VNVNDWQTDFDVNSQTFTFSYNVLLDADDERSHYFWFGLQSEAPSSLPSDKPPAYGPHPGGGEPLAKDGTKKPLVQGTAQSGGSFTSYCSHVHCEVVTRKFDTGEAHVVTVHHDQDEKYGHKHFCKHQLHLAGKCGCECFDESAGFDLYSQLTPTAHELYTGVKAAP
jgi:hypothetical protein